MITSEVVTAVAVSGGLASAIWAAFKGMALWRAGTSGRQQNLMARLERENARAYHDRDEHERRYLAAYRHIREVERAHRTCGFDVPVFEPPPWQPYRGEREREGKAVEIPDDT